MFNVLGISHCVGNEDHHLFKYTYQPDGFACFGRNIEAELVSIKPLQITLEGDTRLRT